MIICVTEPETETSAGVASMGIRSWRWVLSIGLIYLSLDQQLKTENDPNWRDISGHYRISFRPFYWRFGADQQYYDGMWYSMSFGPFHINWYA